MELLSWLGEVVLANLKFCVFSKWAPNTSRYPVSGRLSCLGQGPAILCRVGCSDNCCVFEIWAPNTSRYPVSGRVFFRYGPRTRPTILSRGGCSCKRQVLGFFKMRPEHVPLSCVGQVDFYNCCVFEIWAPNTSRYPVSGRLFLQTSISMFFRDGPRTRPATLRRAGGSYNCRVFDIWAPNTSRYPGSGTLFLQATIIRPPAKLAMGLGACGAGSLWSRISVA